MILISQPSIDKRHSNRQVRQKGAEYTAGMREFGLVYLAALSTVHFTNCYSVSKHVSDIAVSRDTIYPIVIPATLQERVNEGASSSKWPFGAETFPRGWIALPFMETGNIVPIELTATVLEDFYQLLFEKATENFWTNDPFAPGHGFGIANTALQLIFSFYASVEPLPWHIIAVFAFNMLEATRRGYTGFYTGGIQSPGGILYHIALDFIHDIGQGG